MEAVSCSSCYVTQNIIVNILIYCYWYHCSIEAWGIHSIWTTFIWREGHILRSKEGKIFWLDTITCYLDEFNKLPLPSQLFSIGKCWPKNVQMSIMSTKYWMNKSKFRKLNIRKYYYNSKNNQEDSYVLLWGQTIMLLCGHVEAEEWHLERVITGPTEPELETSHTHHWAHNRNGLLGDWEARWRDWWFCAVNCAPEEEYGCKHCLQPQRAVQCDLLQPEFCHFFLPRLFCRRRAQSVTSPHAVWIQIFICTFRSDSNPR